MSHSGPNVASATSTRIDSAARHQVAVRTSFDHLVSWVGFEQVRLQKEKQAFCVHKDDLVIGVSRPVRRNENGRGNHRNKAYPSVVSTLAAMEQSARNYLIYLWHNPKTFAERDTFIKTVERRMDHWDPVMNEVARKQITEMPEFYFSGVSVGMAYAHPLSGDTVCTSMIGGMRTILNGPFEVDTGDLVQWIWDIEIPMFNKDGKRFDPLNDPSSITVAKFTSGQDPKYEQDAARRKQYYERGNGVYTNSAIDGGTVTYNAKTSVAFPKALRPARDGEYRLGDKIRVFARAMCSARPFEMIDVCISRQSL